MRNTVESCVLVPVLQSGISGIFVGFAVLSGCAAFGWPWSWAGVSGCVVMLCAWWYFRREVAIRLDAESGLLQPVQVQPVQVQPEPVQAFALTVAYNEGRAGDMLRFGVSPEKFTQWAQGVYEGRSLAESQWIGSRGVFSRGEYTRMLAELLNRGYIRHRSRYHAQGFELCAKGRALVRGASTPFTHSHTLTHSPA